MQLSCMPLGKDEVCVHIHTERVHSQLMDFGTAWLWGTSGVVAGGVVKTLSMSQSHCVSVVVATIGVSIEFT